MKKIPILLFLAISTLFVSCEKEGGDEPNVAVSQEDLQGTWNVTGYLVEDGQTTTVVQGQSITQDYTAYGKDYDMTLTFNDDPKTVVSNGSYTIVITSTILGQSYTQEAPAFSAFEAAEWKIDGSDIVLISEEIETSVQVSELSSTKVVMVMDIDETIVVDEATNSTVQTSGKLTITLEK